MRIGVPKERSIEEVRVPLTPAGVYALVRAGHEVTIEEEAGLPSGFSDEAYFAVGAQIASSPEEVYNESDLILKLLPPTEQEANLLQDGQVLLSFLQLAFRTESTFQALLQKKVTSIGTEIIRKEAGKRPVLVAMSELAGGMLPQIAGRFLERHAGGRGIVLSGGTGVPPANVVILGSGVVGTNAARAFSGLGAQVMMLGRNFDRLRQVDQLFGRRVITMLSNPFEIERAASFCDVLVGAIFDSREKIPKLVTRETVTRMKEGSVIIDVSIDQGGTVETSRPTTHSNPVFVEEGVLHYCVPNIPAAVPRSASQALNNVLLPYVLEIAEQGARSAIAADPSLQYAVLTYEGTCTHRGVARLFNLPYTDLAKAMA
jgi:alanine dehydrogenase